MKFIKDLLRQIVIMLLAGFMIITAYGALTNVNPGDTLSSSSWNEVISKLTTVNTSSTDLVTKSYVDSAVSAAGGITWMGYTSGTYSVGSGLKTLTQACNTQYAGSHWATTEEIMQLGPSYPWTYNVLPRNSSNSSQYHFYSSGWPSGQTYVNGQLGLYISTSSQDYLYLDTNGYEQLGGNSGAYRLACVK